MTWLYVVVQFVLGCILLAWAANRFITSSVSIARYFNLPAMLTGMLFIGFGTSFPEIVVSIAAAIQGKGGIAIGNAIGSNIANIGLVTGITVLISPICIHSQLLKREFPVLIAVSLITGVLFWNGFLSHFDGMILLVLLVIYLGWLMRLSLGRGAEFDVLTEEYRKEMVPKMPILKASIWWVVGLLLLFFAAELLVGGATTMAKWLGISDFVVGLTVVAIGTSLPELAVVMMSALRREDDIAIGSIVGSNIFNLLAVLAVPAFIVPGRLPPHLLRFDFPVMMVMTLLLWVFALFPLKKASIGRWKGLLLLLGFVGYLTCLVTVQPSL